MSVAITVGSFRCKQGTNREKESASYCRSIIRVGKQSITATKRSSSQFSDSQRVMSKAAGSAELMIDREPHAPTRTRTECRPRGAAAAPARAPDPGPGPGGGGGARGSRGSGLGPPRRVAGVCRRSAPGAAAARRRAPAPAPAPPAPPPGAPAPPPAARRPPPPSAAAPPPPPTSPDSRPPAASPRTSPCARRAPPPTARLRSVRPCPALPASPIRLRCGGFGIWSCWVGWAHAARARFSPLIMDRDRNRNRPCLLLPFLSSALLDCDDRRDDSPR